MAGRYKKLVQYGRESVHKSRVQGDPGSLDTCMNAVQHISKEDYETIRGAWEKSAAADSAKPNSKAILQRLCLLFPAPTIGGCQCSAGAYVRRTPSFFVRQFFSCANVLSTPRFLYAPMFLSMPIICRRLSFAGANVFVYIMICWRKYFEVFFRLRLIIVVMIMNWVYHDYY